MIPAQNMALGPPVVSLNGSTPRCEHLDGLQPVTPQSDDCRDCRDRTDRLASLAVCLTCGWVACSGDSPGHHARAHYEETDHPLAAGLAPGPPWRWCHVHQRLV
jgi:uncharacterized UBP type Zn finger protein